MQIKRKLQIMFDLHGVAAEFPNIYKPLMKSMRACGHTVYICSGPSMKNILKELDDLNYKQNHHYDIVISVTDWLIASGVDMTYDEKGNPWTTDDIWWRSKGNIASCFKIDLMIDDSIQYAEHLPEETKFLLMK